MKSNLEKRASRALLTALLQSDFNNSELRKISELFNTSPNFCWEFGDLLRNISNQIEGSSISTPVDERLEDDFYEKIQSAIKKRRVSKNRIMEYIDYVRPGILRNELPEPSSIHELINNFISAARDPEIRLLLSLLDGNSSNEDPFLKGISKRK